MVLDNLLDRISGQRTEKRWNLRDPATWFVNWMGGGSKSTSGKVVNSETAMRTAAVYACVRVLAETVASLPCIVYRRKGRGKERVRTHPLHNLLTVSPNDQMTSFGFFEAMMVNNSLEGNSYAAIQRSGLGGAIIKLVHIPSSEVTVSRDPGTQTLKYVWTRGDGRTVDFISEEMIHIPSLGTDGVLGKSPIAMMRETIGLSIAAEEYGARFFGQGSVTPAVLEYPGKLSEKAGNRFKKQWKEDHQGVGNAHKIAILEQGMTYKPIGIAQKDSQFIETRKLQRNEIAMAFRVPPHMIGDLERMTFNNVEQQAIDFVVHTIRPWLRRYEQELNRKLFSAAERARGLFCEFLIDALLRGDIVARYSAYATARQWGWFSANDVLEKENLNPLPGEQGDIYLVPANMMSAESLLEDPEPPPPPPDPAEGDDANDQDDEAEENDADSGDTRALAIKIVVDSHMPSFLDASRRMIEKITKAVRASNGGGKDPEAWVKRFYKDHRGWVENAFRGPIQSLSSAIWAVETDGMPETEKRTAQVDRFFTDFVRETSGYGQNRLKIAAMSGNENVLRASEEFNGAYEMIAERSLRLASKSLCGALT